MQIVQSISVESHCGKLKNRGLARPLVDRARQLSCACVPCASSTILLPACSLASHYCPIKSYLRPSYSRLMVPRHRGEPLAMFRPHQMLLQSGDHTPLGAGTCWFFCSNSNHRSASSFSRCRASSWRILSCSASSASLWASSCSRVSSSV